MSRQLRHNFSDPAIRSALVQAVNGTNPWLESTPHIQSARESQSGSSAPDSAADVPHFLRPTSSSRLRQKHDEPPSHTNRSVGAVQNSNHRGRRRGDRPFLYVPTLHAKPIPLRGGGHGGGSDTVEVPSHSGNHSGVDDVDISQTARQFKNVSSLSPEVAVQIPFVCSIATPAPNTPVGTRTPVKFEGGHSDFHEQMHATRHRLASLEAEQRKLIDTSLGALAKATCAMSDSGFVHRDSLPSVSTLTCRPPLGNGNHSETSFFAELPGETIMVPSSNLPNSSSSALPLQTSDLDAERLEDENNLLREAIAMARKRNEDIVAKCKEAETRSKLLEEENQTLSAKAYHVFSPDRRVGGDDPSQREEARRDLLHLSSAAEKKLEELFKRRQNLQAMMMVRNIEPALNLPVEALSNRT